MKYQKYNSYLYRFWCKFFYHNETYISKFNILKNRNEIDIFNIIITSLDKIQNFDDKILKLFKYLHDISNIDEIRQYIKINRKYEELIKPKENVKQDLSLYLFQNFKDDLKQRNIKILNKNVFNSSLVFNYKIPFNNNYLYNLYNLIGFETHYRYINCSSLQKLIYPRLEIYFKQHIYQQKDILYILDSYNEYNINKEIENKIMKLDNNFILTNRNFLNKMMYIYKHKYFRSTFIKQIEIDKL